MRWLKLLIANTQLIFDELCSKTVIDGVKYLHSSKPAGVRLFWSLLLFCFAIISAIIIVNFYEQYEKNAIITVIDFIPRGQAYDFPSVFICPDDAWNETKLEKLAIKVKRKYKLKIETNVLVQCLRGLTIESPSTSAFPELCADLVQGIENGEFQPNMREAFIEVPDLIRNCRFKGLKIDCGSHFMRYFTEKGLCVVFNNININYDNLSNGEENIHKLIEFESSCALKFELRVPNTQTNNFLNKQFYLVPPFDMLTLRHHAELLWTKSETPANLKFSIWENTVSTVLRQLSISQRKCMFRNELLPSEYTKNTDQVALYYYDICILHCHSHEIYKKCQCLPRRFVQFMRVPESFPICCFEGFKCARKLMPTLGTIACKLCLRNCYHINYNTVRDIGNDLIRNGLGNTVKGNSTSPIFRNLTIALNNWPRFRYKTTIIYGIFDLLVSFAGVASFFFGFSFIAVFEIIFYFSVRYVCTFFTKKAEIERQVKKNEKLPGPINLSLVPCKQMY